MNEDNNNNGGIGILTILFTVFLVLKLTGVITWSWVWVLSPLWIPIALIIPIMMILYLFLDHKINTTSRDIAGMIERGEVKPAKVTIQPAKMIPAPSPYFLDFTEEDDSASVRPRGKLLDLTPQQRDNKASMRRHQKDVNAAKRRFAKLYR